MKKIIAISSLLLAAVFATGASAGQEFFNEGTLIPLKQGDPVSKDMTIGGYPFLMPEDGNWTYHSSSTSKTTGGDTPVTLGKVSLTLSEGKAIVSGITITANLNNNNSTYFGGEPCASNNLYVNKLSKGRDDNCLTINYYPQTGLFILRSTQTSRNGRYLYIEIGINADFVGVRSMRKDDWGKDSIDANPHKKAFFDKLTSWGRKFQDASHKAFQSDKPLDAYASVPPIRSLVNVPEAFANQNPSLLFLSVLTDVSQHLKGHRSVAYVSLGDRKTRWGYTSEKDSKEAAEAAALETCEKGKDASIPPCQIAITLAP